MKILKDINKEQDQLFHKTKKEIKKDKERTIESVSLENIQNSLNLEFEEKSIESKKTKII